MKKVPHKCVHKKVEKPCLKLLFEAFLRKNTYHSVKFNSLL